MYSCFRYWRQSLILYSPSTLHCKHHVAHKSSQVWPFDTGSDISQCRLLFPRETWAGIEHPNLLNQVITFAIKWCSSLFRQRFNFLLYLSISFTSPCLLLQSLHLSLTFFSRWERLAIDLCSIHPFPVSRRAESLSLYPQSPSITVAITRPRVCTWRIYDTAPCPRVWLLTP